MQAKSHSISKFESDSSSERLIRQSELLKLTSKSRSSLYREINEGTFPAPVRIGKRAVAWRASEVYSWMDNLPKAAGMEG
mgnify:CR=1 FL=1